MVKDFVFMANKCLRFTVWPKRQSYKLSNLATNLIRFENNLLTICSKLVDSYASRAKTTCRRLVAMLP